MPLAATDGMTASQDSAAVDAGALDVLFRSARSQNGWLARDIEVETLRKIWELAKWGPTSSNMSPMRVIFVRSVEGKKALLPFIEAGNVHKVTTAPVSAIIGADYAFYEHLPVLFPHNPAAADRFRGDENKPAAAAAAFRNGSLQGAYFMIAARAYGLDCGPISGFDGEGVDQAFWQGTQVRTNFICNLGYGDPSYLFPRLPRLSFEQVCRIM